MLCIKECIRLALDRTLRKGESIARHAELGKQRPLISYFLPRFVLPIIYILCYTILSMSAFFCLLLGYSLSEEKYKMWQKDFITNIFVNVIIKVGVEAVKFILLIIR